MILRRRWLPRLLVYSRRVIRNDHTILAMLAVGVGIAAGFGAVLFRYMIGGVQWVALGIFHEQIVDFLNTQPAWRIILAPTLGGLIVGIYVHRVFGGRRAEAVADVMAAVALKDARMPLRTGIHSAVVHALSLGSGASTGREGPVVHLGATLASTFGRWLGLGPRMVRTLVGCGVAAAVAASFNAPIAGVFFALEVVIGHYALSAFAPVVLAAVAGTVVARGFYGDYPAFILPDFFGIGSVLEFPAFALLGVVSAVVAITFMRCMIFSDRLFQRSSIPVWLRPSLAGLILGIAALRLPELLGVGYDGMESALKAQMDLHLLIVLIFAKIAATSLCYGAGFGGGVFSPSLFLGAMTGGAFGIIATLVAPDLSSGHGAYTLIGMGAVAGAVLGAPISTMLIIFELTGDYTLTIAVMVSVSLASIITDQVQGKSFFTWQLANRGIQLKGGREMGLLKAIHVSDVMKHDQVVVDPSAGIEQVADALSEARYGEIFVVSIGGELLGMITLADLAHVHDPAHPEVTTDMTALEIARKHPPVLEMNDDISAAMREMDMVGESHLPVIASRDTPMLVGFVHEHDVMLAYHRALLEARSEEQGMNLKEIDPKRR